VPVEAAEFWARSDFFPRARPHFSVFCGIFRKFRFMIDD